jgi:hypothetical protein
MVIQGSKIPKMKRNFFGEVPFLLRIVQEKVIGSKPKVPQTLNAGRIKSPKQNIHTKSTIRAT